MFKFRKLLSKSKRWARRTFSSRSAWIKLGITVFVLALIAVGLAFGRNGYQRWKERRFVGQAQTFLKNRQYSQALLSVRKALWIDGKDPVATKIIAELAERAGYPIAVFWRKRVVDLEPKVLQHRLDWVSTTLKFADPNLAVEALETVDDAGKKTLDFQRMAARVAFAANELDAATAHLAEAVRLSPTNDLLRLNLAILRLRERDPVVLNASRLVLQELQTNALVGDEALRVLARDALRHRDVPRAAVFTKQLAEHPQAMFPDRLLRLTTLRELKDPGFPEALVAAQREARKDPVLLYGMSTWMLENQMPDEALSWLKALPPDLESRRILPMLLADCYLARKDWHDLESWLREEDWDRQEFLRYATLAYSLRQQGVSDAAHANWEKAMSTAGDRFELLASLAQLSTAWGWHAENEEVLWVVARKYPRQRWALKSLHMTYLLNGNTHGLLNLYNMMVKLNPSDLRVLNNKAAVCLLLNTELPEAHRLAHEVYSKNPKMPTFVSTYAYSLHVQGRTGDALKLMKQLTPDQLRNPSTAAYYCVMLSAAGQKDQAREYLALAQRARLLPEERAMLEKLKS